MAHVTSQRAREAAKKPSRFRGYPVSCGEYAVLYDSEAEADALAKSLGTYAKHAPNKEDGGDSWVTFSIVKLPEGWEYR